jgi:hypothetical protein
MAMEGTFYFGFLAFFKTHNELPAERGIKYVQLYYADVVSELYINPIYIELHEDSLLQCSGGDKHSCSSHSRSPGFIHR